MILNWNAIRKYIRAVGMDFDNTIYDSGEPAKLRIVEIAGRLGCKIPKNVYARLEKYWGLHGTALINKVFKCSDEVSEKIHKEWETEDLMKPYPLIEGAKETLFSLKSEGFILFLLTNRHRKTLGPTLNMVGLDDMFHFIQAGDDPQHIFKRPDPRVFNATLNFLAQYGIEADKCLYIGDALSDFVAAQKRGLKNLSVLTGFTSRDQFLKAGQDKENIIKSLADLIGWLARFK